MTKGEQTKLKITLTAIEEAYQLGWNQVNFNQLSKTCGLSQPAFYKYFKDKTDLLYHCLLNAASEGRSFIDSKVKDRDFAKEKLKKYLKGNLQWARKYPEQAHIIISMYYFSHNHKKIQETFSLITATGLERIQTILIFGNREGAWKIQDIDLHANMIHNLLVGEILKGFNSKKFKQSEDKFLSYIFNYILSVKT